MIELIAIPVVLWTGVITYLALPKDFMRNKIDKLTHARFRDDRNTLQLMLDHLRTNPEKWSIARDAAFFPKEGAKAIYINRMSETSWTYSLAAFGRDSMPLEGYFKSEFVKTIQLHASLMEQKSLLRTFYPHLEGTLLLS